MAVKAGKLRRSQLITTFGCGAIASLPRESVVMAGTDYWKQDDCRLSEEILQSYLGVRYFVTPPGPEADEPGTATPGIPAFRFPTWMYCPKCKRLASVRAFNFWRHPYCTKCRKRLVPSRFVVACEQGHLDNFPYEWWVHRGQECKGERAPELEISFSSKRSGLEGIVIKCKSCDAWRSMAGSIRREGLEGFPCSGARSWLNDVDPSPCNEKVLTILRGATNLYFSVNVSALSIPPWSRKIQYELGKKWRNLEPFLNDRPTFLAVVEGWRMTDDCGCTAEELWDQAKYKDEQRVTSGPKTWHEILEGEYRAFLQGSKDQDGEFITRNVPVPPLLANYVDRAVLAVRLREIMALLGFKRINPEYDTDDPGTYNPVSRELKEWLPAIELKGEGIFLGFSEDTLKEWEQRLTVKMRYSSPRFNDHYLARKGSGFSARYVLLHTLAHLLIRQIILDCGYASASLKERIYCTFADSERYLDMAGILIYTAATDAEGSLGGLVREGYPERLENTFRRMLEAASWCSEDPLCILSSGQGLDALNFAACHACTLLPETSCEKRNCFLDRAAIVGTLEDRSLGFFSNLISREAGNLE
ncbi:MAG: DrmB family protein [Candidatus Desulforudaceae bacterium]